MSISQLKAWAALAALALLSLTISAAWALEEEAQAAKDEGIRLYGINQPQAAIAYLEVAAELGDVDAMYYLGEVSRGDASLEWYHRAAQHGDPYAMLRLRSGSVCEWDGICPDDVEDWGKAALNISLPKAEAGDIDAMFSLYPIYATLGYSSEPLQWLIKAAEGGNAEAQNWLGQRIRDGHVSYPGDIERLEASEQWFRRAAEEDYPRAMTNLAATLSDLERYEEAWQWLSKSSEAGYVTGRLWKAYCHINPEEDGMCQTEKDPAKGWAILLAVHEEAPGIASERSLESYGDGIHVTPEQREAGEKMVEDWLNHEPPLSYFPMKFFGP